MTKQNSARDDLLGRAGPDTPAPGRAVERPDEHRTGWDTFPERPHALDELRRSWRDGLARNTAASGSVLHRLLDVAPDERFQSRLIYRELPEEAIASWLAHPEWRVRKGLAERRGLDAEQRSRLLRDPDPQHRWVILTCAVDDRFALTDAAYAQLADDPSPRVRAELALHGDLPVRHLTALAADPDTEVRLRAAPRAWPHLDAPARAALLADPVAGVRAEAVLRHHRTAPLPAAGFAALPEDSHRERAAESCVLARELAERLVHGAGPRLRHALAHNPRLDPDLVALLGQDDAPDIRWAVSLRPDLTEAERAAVAVEFDPSARCNPLPWVLELRGDDDAVRRCATSAHVMLRRSAACIEDLPPDVTDLLAHDEDRVVRLFLAEHCAQAPAEVLLEVAQRWNGYSAARMVEHPNFPRGQVLRLADDPDPRKRALALLDPEAPADLVERFGRDPDPGVRRRALHDPRLSAASVIRLLDDPEPGIRSAAAADPRLPAHVVAELLCDTATAAQAAANPGIPEAVMHRLLDRRPRVERG